MHACAQTHNAFTQVRREFKAKLSAVEAELKAATNELELAQMALSEVLLRSARAHTHACRRARTPTHTGEEEG